MVLKHSKADHAERQSVINECTLIKALASDHIVTCDEVFDFKGKIWVFMENMDGGDLSKIVMKSNEIYTEEFCKYTLMCVAKGLQSMHS